MMKNKSMIKKLLLMVLLVGALYGVGRLYFLFTAGFSVANISSTFPYDPRWEIAPLSETNKSEIRHILNQEFHYLGRGCQSYVFASKDGNYVLKFFKYQRFRPQVWYDPFTFIPAVQRYQTAKAKERKLKLDKVYRSWKLAYDHLQPETGVVYVHLNKSHEWGQQLLIRDKIGLTHQLNIDEMEFMLQKRAAMFCPSIDTLMHQGQKEGAAHLLDELLVMLLLEYARGYADNDHALMQNTGVLSGKPIHVDVGQFIYNPAVEQPRIYHQELYDKTFKLNNWLAKNYPELAQHLENKLAAIIGIDYFYMGPYIHKGDVAKIPNQLDNSDH